MSATTPKRAQMSAAIEQELYTRREAGQPGLTVEGIVAATGFDRVAVREIVKNLKRTGRAVSTPIEGSSSHTYMVTGARPMPSLGPLSDRAGPKRKPGSIKGEATEVIYPPGFEVKVHAGASYAPLGAYSFGAPARPEGLAHERHGSRRGEQSIPHIRRPVPILGGRASK